MDTNECCPKFDPAPWNEKVFEWNDKRFVRDSVFTLFYMPMNFGGVITRLFGKVQQAGAACPSGICLSDHTSRWNMNIYLEVDKEVPGADNVLLSGKFLSKVYEGPYKETGKWSKDFELFAKGRGLSIKKWYMWYTTCPKCAKKYGKNYVVIVAEVE